MHPIDEMLKLSLEGENDLAWEISERLEKEGPLKILDPYGNNTNDIWLRHCFNRGWHLVQQGKFQEGFRLLESGRFLNTYGGGLLKTEKPIFNPDTHKTEGKSIILSLEGGYGDEIIHARFAPYLKERFGFDHVYIACTPEISPLFERIPGVTKTINRLEAHTVKHDYWVPGFSAGWICGFEYDTLPNTPYITPNLASVELWNSLIQSEKLKVGIRWAGNPEFEHQQFRLFNANFLIKMAEAFPNVQFYSFQRDNNLEKLPNNVVDLQHLIISWEDTAAALTHMDLVISSCTSIAHLSAAMGKKTWVVTPILPYHTWARGAPGKPGQRGSNTSPWYQSIKVYRQIYKGIWQPTFEEIYQDFEKEYSCTRQITFPVMDEKIKKLNLGSGLSKIDGYINLDISPIGEPDVLHDITKFPWPFNDSEINHIVAKDILEHMHDLPSIIKEMYRISKNGAVWEIMVPHHRCDTFMNDPTHVRPITPVTIKMFDQKYIGECIARGEAESYLTFELGVDIELLNTKFELVPYWQERVNKKEITEEQLRVASDTMNNVIQNSAFLIQVHKPARGDITAAVEARKFKLKQK